MVFLLPFCVQADIYMYRDENGVMHFTNKPMPKTSGYRFFMAERSLPQKKKEAVTAAEITQYNEIIKQAASIHNLEENLIRAVMYTESAFNPKALSRKGAMGLMQLMPETAKFLGISDPFSPENNVLAGARYLRMMLDQFDGNEELALAAYNAGPANIIKYKGVPPFRETRDYIRKVHGFREQYEK